MSPSQLHKQVPVKVTAYVDEGIANLVVILNNIPQVSTFSSCEGRLGKHRDDAHIYFDYGIPNKQSWYSSGKFASKLAKVLSENGSYDTEIALEWTGDKETPYISIKIYPEQIAEVFKILLDHKNEFFYDT